MQKLKFENNKIITHRYNVFLFSPLLTGLILAFLCPSLPSSGITGTCQHTWFIQPWGLSTAFVYVSKQPAN